MPCEQAGEAAAKALGGLVLLCVAYNAVAMLCCPAERPRSKPGAAHARRKSSLKRVSPAGGASSARPRGTPKRLSISVGPEAPESATAEGKALERQPRQRSPFLAVAAKPNQGDGGGRRSPRRASSLKRPPPAPPPPPPPLPAQLYVIEADEKAKPKGTPALLLLRARTPDTAEPGAPGAQLYEAQWVRKEGEARGKEGRSARFQKKP